LDIIKREQQRCLQLSRSMAINKIEAFAKDMKELGVKFGNQPLISFGNDLHISTQTFDMDKIQEHLKKFQSLIKT